MFNSLDSAQEAELITLIRQHGLEAVETKILKCAQNSIALVPVTEEAEEAAIGITRLGGFPDCPAGWEWPEGLEFLGQINLEEAAAHDHNGLLPRQGLLSFFFASESWDDTTIGLPHRVFHFDSSVGPLLPSYAPRAYLPYDLYDANVIYKPKPIQLQNSITLPALYTRGARAICGEEGEFDDAYSELLEDLGAETNNVSHRLLGYHKFMDGDADEEVRQILNGAALQHSHSTTEEEQEEWILLLQVDTDGGTGMQFNDAGFAYFIIRVADLVAGRFDRTYASLWSS